MVYLLSTQYSVHFGSLERRHDTNARHLRLVVQDGRKRCLALTLNTNAGHIVRERLFTDDEILLPPWAERRQLEASKLLGQHFEFRLQF